MEKAVAEKNYLVAGLRHETEYNTMENKIQQHAGTGKGRSLAGNLQHSGEGH